MEFLDINSDNNENKKRRRGRPRKEDIIKKEVSEKKSQKKIKKSKSSEKEIILQMPITISDINNMKNNDNIKTDNEIDSVADDVFTKKDSSDNNIFTLADITNTSSEYSSYDGNTELVKKLQEKDTQIRDLREKLATLGYTNYLNYGINEKKIHKMDLKIINHGDNKQIEILKTTKKCWWDHNTFTGYPFFVVEKYHNRVYYVSGCFCSVNCALAYNIKFLDDYQVSERHALTIQLFRELTGNNEAVGIAPTWLSLKDYGGPLSIESFRNNCAMNTKEYMINIPPISYINYEVIESTKDKDVVGLNNNSSDSDNLILKRSKPLPTAKNTLMETMGLTMERMSKKPKK